MTSSTPISPPTTLNTSTAAPTSSSTVPISPVSRSGTFPHKTSAAVSTDTPYIDTSTKAINDTPVEIDGLATTPEEVKKRNTGEKTVSPGLDEDESVQEEFLGEGGGAVGREAREKRAAILASRSKDPAVLVDLPDEPTAEEVEAAKSADGTVTPGLNPPPGVGEK